MRKKNQLHKRLETYKVQEWKQRGRPSPAAAPLAGKHLLLGGWPSNERERKGKMRNEVGHEENHKKNTRNHHLPSKQLPSPEKPFAVAGKRENSKNTHTHGSD